MSVDIRKLRELHAELLEQKRNGRLVARGEYVFARGNDAVPVAHAPDGFAAKIRDLLNALPELLAEAERMEARISELEGLLGEAEWCGNRDKMSTVRTKL